MWKYRSTYAVCKTISASIDNTSLNRERPANHLELCLYVHQSTPKKSILQVLQGEVHKI